METITVTYEVFKFEELAEKVQQKVLGDRRFWNVEHFDWWQFSYEDFTTKFDELGILAKDFSFDLDGHYQSFDLNKPSVIDLQKFVTAAYGYPLRKRILDMLDVSITTTHSYRSVRNTVEVNLSGLREKHKRLGKFLENLQEKLNEFLKEKKRECYKQLEEEYEYRTSDEAIKESLVANDMRFLSDGEVFRE